LTTLERDQAFGSGACPSCTRPIVVALDEFFRRRVLERDDKDGALVVGAEVDGVGDQPEPPIRARSAAAGDPPGGPRWRAHACAFLTG
jgi:hypothetical protein